MRQISNEDEPKPSCLITLTRSNGCPARMPATPPAVPATRSRKNGDLMSISFSSIILIDFKMSDSARKIVDDVVGHVERERPDPPTWKSSPKLSAISFLRSYGTGREILRGFRGLRTRIMVGRRCRKCSQRQNERLGFWFLFVPEPGVSLAGIFVI